jgi:hypothetical protein
MDHIAHLIAWAVERDETAGSMLSLPIYHPTFEEGLKQPLRRMCESMGSSELAHLDSSGPPLMIVQFKPSALRQAYWYEYLVRFGLGGAMTVVAGLIAARFGPVIGGLFLAFPAIFPASATLIEKHVRELGAAKKLRHSMPSAQLSEASG